MQFCCVLYVNKKKSTFYSTETFHVNGVTARIACSVSVFFVSFLR